MHFVRLYQILCFYMFISIVLLKILIIFSIFCMIHVLYMKAVCYICWNTSTVLCFSFSFCTFDMTFQMLIITSCFKIIFSNLMARCFSKNSTAKIALFYLILYCHWCKDFTVCDYYSIMCVRAVLLTKLELKSNSSWSRTRAKFCQLIASLYVILTPT